MPGEGAVNLDLLLRTLKDIGYSEMVSVELFRPEYWEWDIEKKRFVWLKSPPRKRSKLISSGSQDGAGRIGVLTRTALVCAKQAGSPIRAASFLCATHGD